MSLEITPIAFKEKFLSHPEWLELIDVREPSEFDELRIKGSKLIPMGKLDRRLGEIDWSREVIFICRSWARSGRVAQILTDAGYTSHTLAGGVVVLDMNCMECMERGAQKPN